MLKMFPKPDTLRKAYIRARYPRVSMGEGKTIVNYLWGTLPDFSVRESNYDAFCSVPLKAIDKAFDNARRYPDADFIIWVNYGSLDRISEFFLNSHARSYKPANVTFRDAEEVQGVSTDDMDDIDASKIRLIYQGFVENPDADEVFFSDFDIDDVCLNDERLKNILDKQAFIIGCNECSVSNGGLNSENQFMGFRRGQGQKLLETFFLPRYADPHKYGLGGRMDTSLGFAVISQCIGTLVGHRQIGDVGFPIGYPMGHVIPDNPLYTETGINRPAGPRCSC